MARTRIWLASVMLLGACMLTMNTAAAQQLISNGGFETGDFTSWTATTQTTAGCETDWNVSSVGGATATNCQPGLSGSFPGAPFAGTFSAYNSFDGGGPLEYRLEQQVAVPSGFTGATLSWQQTFNIDYTFTGSATVPREIRVELLDGTGTTLLSTLYSESIEPINALVEQDWSPRSVAVSSALAPFAGQTVTIAFVNDVPENFTGPGGFGLDSVSLQSTRAIPAVAPLGAALLGLLLAFFAAARMRRAGTGR